MFGFLSPLLSSEWFSKISVLSLFHNHISLSIFRTFETSVHSEKLIKSVSLLLWASSPLLFMMFVLLFLICLTEVDKIIWALNYDQELFYTLPYVCQFCNHCSPFLVPISQLRKLGQ